MFLKDKYKSEEVILVGDKIFRLGDVVKYKIDDYKESTGRLSGFILDATIVRIDKSREGIARKSDILVSAIDFMELVTRNNVEYQAYKGVSNNKRAWTPRVLIENDSINFFREGKVQIEYKTFFKKKKVIGRIRNIGEDFIWVDNSIDFKNKEIMISISSIKKIEEVEETKKRCVEN